jgi:hypothetical protein
MKMGSSNEQFFQRWAEELSGSTEWYDDDQRTAVIALVVLGNAPVDVGTLTLGITLMKLIDRSQIINTILRENTQDGYWPLWLADTYDNLPDYAGRAAKGTTAPVDEEWHSTFSILHEAVEFVRNIPKPPKPLCKVLCAILDEEQYLQHGELLFVKVDEAEPQVLPCRSGRVEAVFEGMNRDLWPDRLELWEEEGICM